MNALNLLINEKARREVKALFFCFRSLCSLVCKWNYSANPIGKNGWNEDFFEQLNLRDLKKDNWRKIGTLRNHSNCKIIQLLLI